MFVVNRARPVQEADSLPPSLSRLSSQCGIRNMSQPYRPARPVTRITSLTLLAYDLELVGLEWQQTNKLRGLSSASELYRLGDRHLLAKFSANFCGWSDVGGQRGGSPRAFNLSFLDRSRYFSFKSLHIYPHKS
jgi:hypothetical protein